MEAVMRWLLLFFLCDPSLGKKTLAVKTPPLKQWPIKAGGETSQQEDKRAG